MQAASGYRYRFEELWPALLPGAMFSGIAETTVYADESKDVEIDEISLSDGSGTMPLDKANPAHKLIWTAIEDAILREWDFRLKVEEWRLEEFGAPPSDFDQHSTYRVASGSVVG